MKNEKKLLRLLQRTSEPDDQLFREGESSVPVVFVDLETLMIVAEPVVVLPRVFERIYVPGQQAREADRDCGLHGIVAKIASGAEIGGPDRRQATAKANDAVHDLARCGLARHIGETDLILRPTGVSKDVKHSVRITSTREPKQ